MASQIARDFATAGGVTDVNGILEVQMRGQRREVIGIVIHVVSVARLGRPPMAAPVVGDHTKAVTDEKHQLRIPVVSRERPAM